MNILTKWMSIAVAAALCALGLVGSSLAGVQLAPSNSSPPAVTGTASVGNTLTAQNGVWSNSPASYSYEWLRCDQVAGSCVDIAAAAAKTYLVASADAGHRLRVRVTATNSDGSSSAESAATPAVRTASSAPKNRSPPTISGDATVGQQLTADNGVWSGAPTSFGQQWQRCDADGSNCASIAGETAGTYTVQPVDLGFRLRVRVFAKNATATGTANSGVTQIVAPAAKITNHRPSLTILSVHFLGERAYARIRICDDSFKNLTILETDSKPRVLSYTRRFTTLIAPNPCGVYTRHWQPATRFRHGRYTLTLRARDKSGLTSAPARRTILH